MAAKKAFLLRLDPKLWVDLERLAQVDLRSVNAQIEYLLRDGLRQRGMLSQQPPPQSGDPKRDPRQD